jgi:hypothetical protein
MLRRRVSKRVAAVLAAIASISFTAFGQQSAKDKATSRTPQTRITIKSSNWDQTAARLSGTVLDANGAAISGAKILITDTTDKKSAVANDEGRFQLDALPEGDYSIRIAAVGFAPYLAHLLVERNRTINLEVILEPGTMMGEVVILKAQTHFDTTPGTTIISGDLIRRLPIQ